MPVASLQNPQIKYLRKLARRKFREKEQKFLVEGTLMVAEALLSSWPLELLIYTAEWGTAPAGQKILSLAGEVNLPCLPVEKKILAAAAAAETPQGVLAVARRRDENPAGLFNQKPSLLLLVDAVQDPGNFGAMIRAADAAGADGALFTRGTVDLYNPKTLRATMGSVFHLPVLPVLAEELPAQLSGAGLRLVAGDPGAEEILADCDLTRPTVLAVGNEARGCADEILKLADRVVRIPMPGRAESLNAAAAAAIMLYEAVRQRRHSTDA